jgi:hypothetical protein
MIYFTTFILTLILSHIARATAACGDVASPEELYDPTYTDAQPRPQRDQHSLPPLLYNVTWTNKYDNRTGNTKDVVCSELARKYPHFKDFIYFPFIGGASFIKKGSNFCGTCWNLTNPRNGRTISIAPIDSVKQFDRFNISETSFDILNGGKFAHWLLAIPRQVDGRYCGFPK